MTAREDYRRENQARQHEARLKNKRQGRVMTPDGAGRVIGGDVRKNTNGGPGTQQWRVQLDDGRIRHYAASVLVEVKGEA